jgi:hypothetical protein
MTVLVSVNERQISPQAQDLAFTAPIDATQIVVTLTHGDWPDGVCARAEIMWGGVSSGVFQTSGGVVRDKAGNPTGGTMVTTRTCAKPAGITDGVARVEVLQTLRTAILVEAF